jgi:EAL domain-containing protein (putative c-di-GMP-specific phosphodiesterase class I)
VRGSETLAVSVSIGAVAVAGRRERARHLLAAGELACQRAQRDGGGRLVTIEGSGQPLPVANRQSFAAASLQEALKSNHFQLEAQSIVALRGRAELAVGCELLVRLRDASGKVLAPDSFLEACETYGLLPALDRWVLCSTVDTLRGYARDLTSSSHFFTLNVSGQSLESRKYADFALEYFTRAGLSPALFCFELKEAAALGNLAAAEAFIRAVSAAGCKVALDDFGSGLSSLAHLKQLPAHYLKIDGRFVRRIGSDRIAESIVSGIARAARTLGVITIAEHVESAAVADRLSLRPTPAVRATRATGGRGSAHRPAHDPRLTASAFGATPITAAGALAHL